MQQFQDQLQWELQAKATPPPFPSFPSETTPPASSACPTSRTCSPHRSRPSPPPGSTAESSTSAMAPPAGCRAVRAHRIGGRIDQQQVKLGACRITRRQRTSRSRPPLHRVRLCSVILLTAGFQGKPCHGTGQRPHSHFRIRYPTPGATRITSRSSRDLPT